MSRNKEMFRLDLDNDEFPHYLIRETRRGQIEWEKRISPVQVIFDGKTNDDLVHVSKSSSGIYLSSTNRLAWETNDPNCKISEALKRLWLFLGSLELKAVE